MALTSTSSIFAAEASPAEKRLNVICKCSDKATSLDELISAENCERLTDKDTVATPAGSTHGSK